MDLDGSSELPQTDGEEEDARQPRGKGSGRLTEVMCGGGDGERTAARGRRMAP